MKCPYSYKIGACAYLEETKYGSGKYECPNCPHYAPKTHYYNDPERESKAIFAITISLIMIGIILIALFVNTLIKIIIF